MKPTLNLRLTALAACVAAFALATTAHAQTGDSYVFTGGYDGGNWSDTANWENGYAPDATNDADGLASVFLAPGAGTSTVDATYYISSITQEATAADTLATSGGDLLANGSTVTNLMVDNLSTSALTISGTINDYTGSQLTFNSGSYYVTGSVSSGYQLNINSAASVITSNTGSVASSYNSLYNNGTLGGSGSVSGFSGGGSVINSVGSTLKVGDPTVNHGVGVLTASTDGYQYAGFYIGTGSAADFTFYGNSHSELETNSFLMLQSGATFDITSTGGATAPGVYDLITYGGTYGAVPPDPSTDLLVLPTGWTGTLGIDGGNDTLYLDLTSTGESNVPEPTTWALLGLGLVSMVFLARRKLARQS